MWHCVWFGMWASPRTVSLPSEHEAFRKNKKYIYERKKGRKNNFILFIGWMTRALETGLVRIGAFTPRRCWFGAASNYKCLCMRAYTYTYVYIYMWTFVCVCSGARPHVRARIYEWLCAARWYLLSEHHFTVNFTHTHSRARVHTHYSQYIRTSTKQPAYGSHRKTYFPLKTHNMLVCVCVSVWCAATRREKK